MKKSIFKYPSLFLLFLVLITLIHAPEKWQPLIRTVLTLSGPFLGAWAAYYFM